MYIICRNDYLAREIVATVSFLRLVIILTVVPAREIMITVCNLGEGIFAEAILRLT